VLDHILVDVISAIRRSFDEALLQRQAVEERFQVDVFLGDVSWETSYSLPGEEQPPRVRADVSVDWPTWSQTSYRSWSIGEPPDELPEIVVEIALRVQRLAQAPDNDMVLHALPEANPLIGMEPLVRTATTIEQVHAGGHVRWAVEATYEGSLRFSEAQLEEPREIDPVVSGLTRWISSTLVQLADLPFAYQPPHEDEDRDAACGRSSSGAGDRPSSVPPSRSPWAACCRPVSVDR
jgi:hypothetical protein